MGIWKSKGYSKETDIGNKLSLFAESKLSLFKLLSNKFSSIESMDFIWARIFFAYGQRQRKQSLIPYVYSKISQDATLKLKTPYEGSDFIHVYDIAEALMALITTKKANYLQRKNEAAQIAGKINIILKNSHVKEII